MAKKQKPTINIRRPRTTDTAHLRKVAAAISWGGLTAGPPLPKAPQLEPSRALLPENKF